MFDASLVWLFAPLALLGLFVLWKVVYPHKGLSRQRVREVEKHFASIPDLGDVPIGTRHDWREVEWLLPCGYAEINLLGNSGLVHGPVESFSVGDDGDAFLALRWAAYSSLYGARDWEFSNRPNRNWRDPPRRWIPRRR